MPSAFDLIGHNPALQEHWIRRFIAFVIDAVIVAVVGLFFAIPLSFLGWAWWFSGIFWGGIWFIYSMSMFFSTRRKLTVGWRNESARFAAVVVGWTACFLIIIAISATIDAFGAP